MKTQALSTEELKNILAYYTAGMVLLEITD